MSEKTAPALAKLDALEGRVRSGTLEVLFIHLNHSNPVLDPHSPARVELEARGFGVAEQGQRLAL